MFWPLRQSLLLNKIPTELLVSHILCQMILSLLVKQTNVPGRNQPQPSESLFFGSHTMWSAAQCWADSSNTTRQIDHPPQSYQRSLFFLAPFWSLLEHFENAVLFCHVALVLLRYLLFLPVQDSYHTFRFFLLEEFLLLTGASFSAFPCLDRIEMVVVLLQFIPGVYIVSCIYTSMSTSFLL